jgi:hypothetical protein
MVFDHQLITQGYYNVINMILHPWLISRGVDGIPSKV